MGINLQNWSILLRIFHQIVGFLWQIVEYEKFFV